MNEYNTTSYSYFKGGEHGKTYSECLAALRKKYKADEAARVYTLLSPFQNTSNVVTYDTKGGMVVNSPLYEWQFTINGATAQALKRSLDVTKAHLVLDSYLGPLEFAAKCGLPLAKTTGELNVIRQNCIDWINDDLILTSPHCAHLNNEIKECIFNAAVNLAAAISSFNESISQEWERTHVIENAVIRHIFDAKNREHLNECYRIKGILNGRGIAAQVCKHNLILFENQSHTLSGSEYVDGAGFVKYMCNNDH
jgi:hypothetical protein